MPVVREEKLEQMLRAGELAPVYFFYGREEQPMREAVERIAKAAVEPAFAGFNLHRFQEENLSAGELRAVCDTLPMMGGRLCVTVKNWNIDRLGKQELETLLQLAADPNPAAVLVLYDTRPALEPKKNAKYKKLMDAVEKTGVVTEFPLRDRASLARAVAARCREAGVTIPAAVAGRLAEQCGLQYAAALNEADKLAAYAGPGGEITAQMLEALGVSSVQNTAFDLSNAVLRGQYARAFAILDRLFALRVEPVMILGAVAGSFVSLYRLKAAREAGLPAGQVIADFHYRSKYQIQKLEQDIGRFSIRQIRAGIAALEKADRLLKSSRMDNRTVLEQMLGEMIAARPREGKRGS